jgi:hypothetical protein
MAPKDTLPACSNVGQDDDVDDGDAYELIWGGPTKAPAGPVMPFARFKGRPIAELPEDYCRWLLINAQIKERAVREALEAHLASGPGEDYFE